MITEEPFGLDLYIQMGYQRHYAAQESLDLLERLFFEYFSLGELTRNISQVESLLREVNVLSLDFHAINANFLAHPQGYTPNGFDGREICAIARYAGMADKLQLLLMAEIPDNWHSRELAAQLIWYFLEGYNLRILEFPTVENEDYSKFIVPVEDEELVFFKSHITEKMVGRNSVIQ